MKVQKEGRGERKRVAKRDERKEGRSGRWMDLKRGCKERG